MVQLHLPIMATIHGGLHIQVISVLESLFRDTGRLTDLEILATGISWLAVRGSTSATGSGALDKPISLVGFADTRDTDEVSSDGTETCSSAVS